MGCGQYMHYPTVTKNHQCRGFITTSKSSIWQPWMQKSQTTIEAGCMLFCINLSIQGTLHFMWNYTCPTPPKSTRLTKSTQFENEQHFSFWSKRWKYKALRSLIFNFSILIIMEKKRKYLSFISIWEQKKSKYLIFLWGEKKFYTRSIHARAEWNSQHKLFTQRLWPFSLHSETLNFRYI